MPAKSEVPRSSRDESILPISGDFSEPRGSGAWIAAGVCALALSAFVSLKLKPVDASPPEEPAWATPAPAAAPQAVAPAAKDELEVGQVLEPAMPIVNRAAQAQPAAAETATPAAPHAEPAGAPAAAPRAASTQSARRARREELQRRGHEFTVALNLGTAAQDTTQPAESPLAAAPSSAPEAAAPVVTVAPAPKSPIPDNPY